MKKVSPNPSESSSDSDPLDPAPLSDITEPVISARLRNPRHRSGQPYFHHRPRRRHRNLAMPRLRNPRLPERPYHRSGL